MPPPHKRVLRIDLGHLCSASSLGQRDPFRSSFRGCSSVVEHLLAKERVESSNLFIRFFKPNLVTFSRHLFRF